MVGMLVWVCQRVWEGSGAVMIRGFRRSCGAGAGCLWRWVSGCGLGFVVVGWLVSGDAAADSCVNAAFRVGAAAGLADCRAYELVSPLRFEPFKDLALGYQASSVGGRVVFYSKYGAPSGGPSFGPFFLSTRGAGGWSTENVVPAQTTAGGDFCYPSMVFSGDLSASVLQDGWNWGEGYPQHRDDNGSMHCSHDEPALVAGEPRGAQNLFLRDTASGSYQLVNVGAAGVAPRNAWFQGGSSDFSHVVFTDALQLTGDAPPPPARAPHFDTVGEDLYVWVGGVVRLVTVLPGGAPVW